VPAFKGLPVTSATPAAGKPGDASTEKKAKGPTQIDSQEATFDQKKTKAFSLVP